MYDSKVVLFHQHRRFFVQSMSIWVSDSHLTLNNSESWTSSQRLISFNKHTVDGFDILHQLIGGKHPIIYRVSTILLVVQDLFHPQCDLVGFRLGFMNVPPYVDDVSRWSLQAGNHYHQPTCRYHFLYVPWREAIGKFDADRPGQRWIAIYQ